MCSCKQMCVGRRRRRSSTVAHAITSSSTKKPNRKNNVNNKNNNGPTSPSCVVVQIHSLHSRLYVDRRLQFLLLFRGRRWWHRLLSVRMPLDVTATQNQLQTQNATIFVYYPALIIPYIFNLIFTACTAFTRLRCGLSAFYFQCALRTLSARYYFMSTVIGVPNQADRFNSNQINVNAHDRRQPLRIHTRVQLFKKATEKNRNKDSMCNWIVTGALHLAIFCVSFRWNHTEKNNLINKNIDTRLPSLLLYGSYRKKVAEWLELSEEEGHSRSLRSYAVFNYYSAENEWIR